MTEPGALDRGAVATALGASRRARPRPHARPTARWSASAPPTTSPASTSRPATAGSGSTAGPIAADGRTWSAGVYLTFPFFDGLATRGRTAQAQSDLATAELDYAQPREAIALEIRAAIDAGGWRARSSSALAGTVDQARRLLEMAEQG